MTELMMLANNYSFRKHLVSTYYIPDKVFCSLLDYSKSLQQPYSLIELAALYRSGS